MEPEERPNKIRKLEGESSITPIALSTQDEIISTRSAVPISTEQSSSEQDVNAKIPEEEHDRPNGDEASTLPLPEEIAPAVTEVQTQTGDPPLSKSQVKKLRRKAEWEAKRPERKAYKKEKLQAKRERKREEKRQEIEANPEAAKPAQTPPRQAVQLPVTILIDCDFDNLMLDSERISLATQITRSYSDNKSSPFRAHLTICSFGGELRKRFDNVLTHYKNWRGLRTLDDDFVETAAKAKEWMCKREGGKLAGIFSKYADLDAEAQQKLKDDAEVVYLTSEADEDLTELKPYSTYIIGGLVDKNREKGICFKRATSRHVRTAKLPIGEYMDMSSRKVLATNHVNEIMLRWLECGNWGEAFVKVIPKRKGGKLKEIEHVTKQNDEQADEDTEHEN